MLQIQENKLTLKWLIDNIYEKEGIKFSLSNDCLTQNLHPISVLAEQKLVQKNFILNELWLTKWLAKKIEMQFVDIENYSHLKSLSKQLPYKFAKKWEIVVLQENQNTLTIATCQKENKMWKKSVNFFLKKTIVTVLVEPTKLLEAIKQTYSIKDSARKIYKEQNNITDFINLNSLDLEQNTKAVTDNLINQAVLLNASDIHIETLATGSSNIRFRIDGVMHQMHTLPKQATKYTINRIKIMSGMDIALSTKPQDGRFSLQTNHKHIDSRVSTMPTLNGEKIVLRILIQENIEKNFDELGFNNIQEQIWRDSINFSSGMILLVGPTGCGKTTTLYSSLLSINTQGINITTIEDPIEYEIPNFNQTQVSKQNGVTFNSGLRSLLRQDPDVIMVGEIRDEETAQIAMQAALTGHLVFATLHTPDAIKTIARLVDLGISKNLLQQTIKCVLSQRLLRKICTQCKGNKDKVEHCSHCKHTGYHGRTAVFQLLHNNKNTNMLSDVIDGKKVKIEKFYELGEKLAENKITNIKEVCRVCTGD